MAELHALDKAANDPANLPEGCPAMIIDPDKAPDALGRPRSTSQHRSRMTAYLRGPQMLNFPTIGPGTPLSPTEEEIRKLTFGCLKIKSSCDCGLALGAVFLSLFSHRSHV